VSIHTTPTYEPPNEQYDEESEDPFDVDFDKSPVIPLSQEEDPRRQDTNQEDQAEADKYFKQYLTASLHPDDIMADNSVHATSGSDHNSSGAKLNGTRTEVLDEGARPSSDSL
jgi:hypothetical protein